MRPADEHEELSRRIDLALARDHLAIVYQPIVDLCTRVVIGYEALSRFLLDPRQTPDRWFADAARVGRGTELELAAIERALPVLPAMPAGAYVAVNASPATILSDRLAPVLGPWPLSQIVLEVTENAPIDDYAAFTAALAPLRAEGLRLAIDDTGAGFASLRHILRLAPDIIKLDRSITSELESHQPTRALAAALASFALETGVTIVAEGIETSLQLGLLEALGASSGQGYLLGRPAPFPAVAAGDAVLESQPTS